LDDGQQADRRSDGIGRASRGAALSHARRSRRDSARHRDVHPAAALASGDRGPDRHDTGNGHSSDEPLAERRSSGDREKRIPDPEHQHVEVDDRVGGNDMADPIPSGYHTVTPYLRVTGAAEFIDFLKQAFGANEMHRSLAPDGSIMHADVTIGDSHVMLTEGMENFPPLPGSLFLYVPDVDATYKRAIDAGATSMMEPADQFYGDRTGGV